MPNGSMISKAAAWLGLGRRDQVMETRSILYPNWPGLINDSGVSRRIFDGATASGIPAIGKALTLYGILGGLDLEAWRGSTKLATPSLLQQPDKGEAGSTWFVQQHMTDWLLNGNACHLVTARDAAGFPAATRWFPAHLWTVTQGPMGEDRQYWLASNRVPARDVVHVKRGHDPQVWAARGLGIVQQHLRTLNRAGMQEDAECGALELGGVPSVAIIAPQKDLSQKEANAAGASWDSQFSGPVRRPAILPNGTQVVPLGWSASDSEMIEARKMTLIDIANLTGFDPYWLGSPGSSHNYKSPGPMFLQLLRTAFEPTLSLFEDAWSLAWLPYGQRVRFNRDELTRDDLESTVRTMVMATGGKPLITVAESREYMGRDPNTGPDDAEAASPPLFVPDTAEQDQDQETAS